MILSAERVCRTDKKGAREGEGEGEREGNGVGEGEEKKER